MATRRQGREWALQLLFQVDLNPGQDIDEVIAKFWRQQFSCLEEDAERRAQSLPPSKQSPEDRVAPANIRNFTEELVRGVFIHLDDLDARLTDCIKNWSLHRMGSVERNVLRLALYELLHRPEVPPAVVLNEAIDLAKYFSSSSSGRFVNGVLDKFKRELKAK